MVVKKSEISVVLRVITPPLFVRPKFGKGPLKGDSREGGDSGFWSEDL